MFGQLTDPVLRILAILLPAHCLQCLRAIDGIQWLCTACLDGIAVNTDACPRCAQPRASEAHQVSCTGRVGLGAVHAPLLHSGINRELIHRWKFENRPELTSLLVEQALAHALPPAPPDLVVPIPMHWWRRLHRGYNQSALLAEVLAKACHGHWRRSVAVREALAARGWRRPQHRLDRPTRLQARRGGFYPTQSLRGLRVLLVDDVMTTGATLEAAAYACREAGARSVNAWCLVRTP